jgi:hypothetical protein
MQTLPTGSVGLRARWSRRLTTSTSCPLGHELQRRKARGQILRREMGTPAAGKRIRQTCRIDNPSGKRPSTWNDTNAFPHTITGGLLQPGRNFLYGTRLFTFHKRHPVSFAQQAIVNEQLGQDDDTDVLTVSFSANDYVGHRFGPYSQEVMDVTLRTDRNIETLLDFVQCARGTFKHARGFHCRPRRFPDSRTRGGTGFGRRRVLFR